MEENFKKFGLNKTINFICPFYPGAKLKRHLCKSKRGPSFKNMRECFRSYHKGPESIKIDKDDISEYLSYEDEGGTVGLIAKTAESSSDDEQIRAELEGENKVKSERKAEREIDESEDLPSNISLTSENSVLFATESEMSLSDGELEKRDSCAKCILSRYR